MMRRACEAGRAALLSGGGSTAAVEAAIAVLEDDPAANAGLGSNLTIDGTVECDASIMEGADRTFGACGAVSGVRNPIALAARVLRQQQGPALSLGRVHPVMLVSEGARRWAEAHDVAVCPAADLVTPEARARWAGYRRSLCQSDLSECEAKGAPAASDHAGQACELDTVNDTVGALCCYGGNLSAGVSSGGVWLKSCGRIGEAAAFGAGCWAQDGGVRRAHAGAAASVSGVGEQVMQSLFARRLCLGLASTGRSEGRREGGAGAEGSEGGGGGEGVEAAHECAARLLGSLRHECGPSTRQPAAGAVAVRVGSSPGPADVELLWAHNTLSFAVGYYHQGLEQPCAFVSRTSGKGQSLVAGTNVACS